MNYLKFSDLGENIKLEHTMYGEGVITNVSRHIVTIRFEDGVIRRFPIANVLNNRYFNVLSDEAFDNVKIERITIKKLFDELNNDFVIDNTNNISVLTAPNGCGKTTTFKLLMFALAPSIENFKDAMSVPFEEFSCFINNGKKIVIKKKKERINSFNNRNLDLSSAPLLSNYSDLTYELFNDNQRIESISFEESARNSTMHNSFYEMDDEYRRDMQDIGMNREISSFITKIYTILEKNKCRAYIDFIEANRIQKDTKSIREEINRGIRHARDDFYEKLDYLSEANDEIISYVRKCLADYNRKLVEAKTKLPEKYISAQDDIDENDYNAFKTRWDDYHNELKKYYEIGLLDSTDTVIKSSELKTAFAKKSSFLTTYLDVFEPTIEPLQKAYSKMKLLADIFNKRNKITKKTIKFNQSGICIISHEKPIDINNLSSGEKNDLIMFYRLIFKTVKNGIVLIDEPEISLHIEWQEEYLDHLMDICRMNNLQAIVATHSPSIINGHLELFIDKR